MRINFNPQHETKKNAKAHPSNAQFSKIKTTENVIDQIISSVPSPLKSESEKLYLQKSLAIQQELLNSQSLTKYDETSCKQCNSKIILRNRKSESGFIVTPGFIMEVQINTFVCKTCDIVVYPNLYDLGFVPISEKLIVSWSYMIDARNQVSNGVKLYNYFKSSLRRLCIENVKLSLKLHHIDFHNMAIGLAKCAVAYNSACLLQSCNDMDTLSALLCLHCGIRPITLMSDGNAKNSIFLRGSSDNLYFDKDDESEIPCLDEFLRKCVISVAGSSLFQHYPKEKINVYKIPPIIGKRLISDLKNREHLKKSVFSQQLDLSSVNFNGLEKMVTSGEFDLLKSRSLNLKTLRKIAKELKIPKCSKQSKVMLENVILELFDWLIGGNTNCHKYCHSLGETGGWTDQWCVHNIKYGSKIMILQESVVDPSDIYLSLLYPPLLQVLDDPCTFIAHLFCTEPVLSNELFGPNKGCFEPPHKTQPPRTDHDCPELLPLSMNPRIPCMNAIDNPKSRVHPISQTIRRKVLGTKISESHKNQNECLFHNVRNCLQSSQIKKMSQEGLQMRHKAKRVTSGKRQMSLKAHGDFVVNPKSLVAEIL